MRGRTSVSIRSVDGHTAGIFAWVDAGRAAMDPSALILALGLLLLLGSTSVPAQSLQIDVDRTDAGFWVRPFWLKRIEGTFPIVEGTVQRDLETGSWYVDLQIDARALQMQRAASLAWAQGPEFFDVEQHPYIRYRSRAIDSERLQTGGLIEGELSLRGVTRTLELDVTPAACPEPGLACPVQVQGEVSRSAFGMDARRLSLGDAVHLWLVMQLVPAAPETVAAP